MAMTDKTWSLEDISASTPTDFIAPASGKTSRVAVARFANTASNAGTLTVTRTNAANAVQGTIIPSIPLQPYTMLELRSLIVINPEKIRVTFTQAKSGMTAEGSEG